MSILLQFGALDLRDTSRYAVEAHDHGTIDPQTNLRTQVFTITILGNTPDEVAANQAALLDTIRAAELAAAPNSGRAPVTLVSQPSTTNSITYDVCRDANGLAGDLLFSATAWSTVAMKYARAARLTLTTSAYGRGDRLVTTNLLLNSADPSAASWTKTNLTATANALLGPNGDAVGATLLETTTNGAHTLSQSITKGASAIDYVLAFYATPQGRDYVDLTLQDNGGSNGVVTSYNIATGTMNFAALAFGSGFTAIDSGIIAKSHGYYRCWLAVTVPASVTDLHAVLNLRSDASTTSYAGDVTKGISAWGFTLNPNATQPGPYLETGDSLTLTNGTDQGPYLYDLPGDVEGLVRLTLSDVSTNGVVIQEFRVGQQAVDFAGDYQGVIPITPADGTSSTDSDSVATNIASVIAGQTAQTLGTIAKPAGAPSTDGRPMLIGRVRDFSSGMGAPTGLSATLGAIRQIQSKGYDLGSNASNHTLVFPKTATAGNKLRASLFWPHGTTVTTPTGWTAATPKDTLIGQIGEFYKQAVGDETSVTFAMSSAVPATIEFEEVAGLAASSAADVSVTSNGSGAIVSGTTATTAQANEYAVAAIITSNTDKDLQGKFTNGFSMLFNLERAQGTNTSFLVGSKKLTAVGTVSTGMAAINGSYATYIQTYKGLTSGAPSVPAGSHTFSVAAVDAAGNVGMASTPLTVALSAVDAVALNWVAPIIGPAVDHYRVYKQNSGNAIYFDTPDATPQYIFTSEASPDGTTAPNIGISPFGEYRVGVALGSGTRYTWGPWVATKQANGVWEALDLGIPPGTAQPTRWGADALGWTYQLAARNESTGNRMDFDIGWLFPSDRSALRLRYRDEDGDYGGLATNRDWGYDLRPDLLASCVLYETGTANEVGEFFGSGRLLIGPGAVQLIIAALVDALVSNVSDAAFQIELEYTARYEYLASS